MTRDLRKIEQALQATVLVALAARPQALQARALAGAMGLAPRYLEPLLQHLVSAHILVSQRGPKGGYRLARERRRITAGEVARAVMDADAVPPSGLGVVDDIMADAWTAYLARLDGVTLEALCSQAKADKAGFAPGFGPAGSRATRIDFAI